MKPLLSKATRPILIFVLLVLAISIPVYYLAVDAIWKSELDEHNKITADKTAYGLSQLNLSTDDLNKRLELWNSVRADNTIQPIGPDETATDSVFTIEKHKHYSYVQGLERFRCLSTIIWINDRPYRFFVETNIEEAKETIAVLAITTISFFIIIVIGLLLINRRLSRTLWLPFKGTLQQLQGFNLHHESAIDFPRSEIAEFEELNGSLRQLIDQNIAVYRVQKEFTENASHELQTPLAILKNKVDLLLQSNELTENQYLLAEDMNKALARSARINKNLLLLAKIENSQFSSHEQVNLDILLNQSIDSLQEHFQQKNLQLQTDIAVDKIIQSNISLCEILINNLLLNAIRHTEHNGAVTITLSDEKLVVTNSGTQGLNADLLFKRFSRQSTDTSGSGLGLAIITQICRAQKWTVQYRFENDQHSFSVSF